METTFYNITITIDANTPAEAYTRLCDALETVRVQGSPIEWRTDTYETETGVTGDTLELMPRQEIGS